MMGEYPVDSISCPYCNALVDAGAPSRSDRLQCPRCGESFPVRAPAGDAPAVSSVHRSAFEEPLPIQPRQPWSNRAVARLVLLIMVSMAGVGLTYALLTQHIRRSRDRQPEEGLAAVRPVPPAELTGLRFLPANTNVVAAVHVAEALATDAGRKLLDRNAMTNTPHPIESWTGLKLEEIDHAILGLHVSERVPPPLVLVVHTRRAYDETQVRQALNARRAGERAGGTLYNIPSNSPLFTPVLWCVDRYTLIVAGRASDLEPVPQTPAGGVERLPETVQQLIKEKIPTGSQAWVAGQPELQNLEPALRLLTVPGIDWAAWTRVRTLTLGARLGKGVALDGRLECADPKTARALEGYLREFKPQDALQNLTVNPAAEPLVRELAETFRFRRQDNELILHATAGIPNSTR